MARILQLFLLWLCSLRFKKEVDVGEMSSAAFQCFTRRT